MYKLTASTLAWLLLGLLLTFSCSPKVTSNVIETTETTKMIPDYASFAFIEQDTVGADFGAYLGDIEIKEGGFTINCDYQSIQALARDEANTMGGNCVVLTEHKKPDRWSTCHRIKGRVYRIDDASEYETEILWHPKRPLEIKDFKGSIENRPFQAATFSGIRYQFYRKPFSKHFKIVAEAYFVCNDSYFNRSSRDSLTLDHEQLHFDISELYARKFINKLNEEINGFNDALAKHEEIFRSISSEINIKQDEYDSEVYADRSKQSNWRKWVKAELDKYYVYRHKTVMKKVKG